VLQSPGQLVGITSAALDSFHAELAKISSPKTLHRLSVQATAFTEMNNGKNKAILIGLNKILFII
jgi:hypothetical protein